MKLINRLRYGTTNLGLWHSGILIFTLSLLVRVAIIVAAHPYRDLARYELERTALSLARTGLFGDPYALPTGPTAHVSPGYTILLAGIFRLFGDGTFAEIVKELLSSVVTSLGFALLPVTADRLIGLPATGLLAGFVCALFPWKPLVQIDGDWETPYTALFLTVIACVTVHLWTRKRFNWRSAIVYGLMWGLALLFSSVLLPLIVVLSLLGAWFCRGVHGKSYARFTLVELMVAALCLIPWVIRNERALGAPIATRSNLGLELRVSNNGDATPDQRDNLLLGVYDKYHPLQNVREAQQVKELGEVAYNRRASSQAKEWIQSHPKRFLQLTIGRIKDFWFYPDPSKLKAVWGDLTAVLGLAGLIWIWRRNRMSGAVLTCILLVYSAPSYLIHVGARQRFPVDWLLVLLSVAVTYSFVRRRARSQIEELP